MENNKKFYELFSSLLEEKKQENGAIKDGSRISITEAAKKWGKPLNFFESKAGYPGLEFENNFVLFSKKGQNELPYEELVKTPVSEIFFHEQWKVDQETQEGSWVWVATLNSGSFTATNKVAIQWDED